LAWAIEASPSIGACATSLWFDRPKGVGDDLRHEGIAREKTPRILASVWQAGGVDSSLTTVRNENRLIGWQSSCTKANGGVSHFQCDVREVGMDRIAPSSGSVRPKRLRRFLDATNWEQSFREVQDGESRGALERFEAVFLVSRSLEKPAIQMCVMRAVSPRIALVKPPSFLWRTTILSRPLDCCIWRPRRGSVVSMTWLCATWAIADPNPRRPRESPSSPIVRWSQFKFIAQTTSMHDGLWLLFGSNDGRLISSWAALILRLFRS